MPRVTNTRKHVAARLRARLERGPEYIDHPARPAFTPEEAKRQYRIWAESWILDDLEQLVPELRKLKED
jgi:hypothetical protein